MSEKLVRVPLLVFWPGYSALIFFMFISYSNKVEATIMGENKVVEGKLSFQNSCRIRGLLKQEYHNYLYKEMPPKQVRGSIPRNHNIRVTVSPGKEKIHKYVGTYCSEICNASVY